MKAVPILLALAGVAVSLLLLAWVDFGAVIGALASVGWGGFGLLLGFQGGLFLLLAAAWKVVLPGVPYPLLVWGRSVRDAATNCLPFSPVGGFVIGARALTVGVGRRGGVAWPLAAAGTVVDATAEIVGQLLYALFGVGFVLLARPGAPFIGPLAAGVGVGLALLGVAVWQRRRIGTAVWGLGAWLMGEWFAAGGGLDRLQGEMGRVFSPGRMAAASAVHLLGWFASGAGTWVALRLLGLEVAVAPVLALEALLDAVLALAFLVPGAAGVQEAGYVGIGLLFGVPPDLALGVSLLRRGKDLVWALPVLGLWQWREVRRLASAGAAGS